MARKVRVKCQKPWIKPELSRLGTMAQVSATQSTLIQTGNSKS